MGFWAYLDARAKRRDERCRLLISKGLDRRSMLRDAVRGADPRFLVALGIIGLFAAAFLREADKDTRNLMVGALIAAFAGAWGYYLGSSSGAANAQARADKGMDLADKAIDKLQTGDAEPDAELAPGETARAIPGKP